jgi:hypothetical protein
MEPERTLTCEVIRVTRPNTLLIRTMAEAMQSYATIYLVLAGVRCKPSATRDIIDWLEINSDFGRYELMVFDWMRDSYGRLLGNILDRRTGDALTTYLIQRGSARPRDNHLDEVMRELLSAQEPEEL